MVGFFTAIGRWSVVPLVGGRLFLGKWSVVGGRWSVVGVTVVGVWSVGGGCTTPIFWQTLVTSSTPFGPRSSHNHYNSVLCCVLVKPGFHIVVECRSFEVFGVSGSLESLPVVGGLLV